jgi:hypothetical protein
VLLISVSTTVSRPCSTASSISLLFKVPYRIEYCVWLLDTF